MINLMRGLNPVNIFLLLLFTFFMRIAFFTQLPDQLNFEFLEPYAKLFLSIPEGDRLDPEVNVLIAGLLVFTQALIFNRVINNHALNGRQSYLPALLYITASSLFLPFLIISPALICNFLVIWLIDKSLKLGKAANGMTMVFDMGMIIALGTLIYFPFIIMLLMIWLSLLTSRPFYWREWLMGLFGFMTIFFFLAVFYYWNDNLSQFYKIWLPLTNKFPSVFLINYTDYFSLIPIILIMILAILELREKYFKSFISTRKAFQMLFFMFVITMASFYLKPDFRVYHFLLCVPSGAVLLSYYFSNARKRWFYESLFIVLVVTIQYFLFV